MKLAVLLVWTGAGLLLLLIYCALIFSIVVGPF